MSDPEITLPPRKPNTFRTWLPRLWNGAAGIVAAHPDKALIVFLVALGVAIIF